MDKVSVIITTYKRKPTMVRRAVRSVLNQTYDNLEIIVVDDSPDTYENREKVKEVVASMGNKVRYVAHKTNKGACAARNTGIECSNGAFVGFLDDDDEWLPQKLEKQMRMFENQKIGMVFCKFWVYEEGKNRILYQDKVYEGNIYDKLLEENFIGSTSVVVLRKEIAIQAGMFDVQMKSAQDIDMWIRCSKICRIACVHEPLVNYYIHGGDSITKNPEKKIQGMERIMEKYQVDINRIPKAVWRRGMRLSVMYAASGRTRKAVSLYRKTFSKKPFAVRENLYYLKMILRTSL